MMIPELPGYLTRIGGAEYKGLIIALFTLMAGISRPFSGKLTDTIGRVPVMVFGSLVHQHWFTMTSDIDLAVWGLNHEDYFTAVAKLQDLDPEFEIDLIRMESCREALKEIIPQEGKML